MPLYTYTERVLLPFFKDNTITCKCKDPGLEGFFMVLSTYQMSETIEEAGGMEVKLFHTT